MPAEVKISNGSGARLQPLARILFIALWGMADRDGRLEDRSKLIKAQCLPYDQCDIDELLNELAGRGFIRRYEVDGARYIDIPKFGLHQNPHHAEKSRDFPAFEANTAPAPDKPETSPGPAPDKPSCSRADSLLLIPDSLIPSSLIPDPLLRIPETLSTSPGGLSRDVLAVFAHYRIHHPKSHRKPVSSSKEWRAIAARLKEGHTVDELEQAINGCHCSPFHCGQNDQQTKHLGLALIMRDGSQVAKFIEAVENPPAAVLSGKTQRSVNARAKYLERKRENN